MDLSCQWIASFICEITGSTLLPQQPPWMAAIFNYRVLFSVFKSVGIEQLVIDKDRQCIMQNTRAYTPYPNFIKFVKKSIINSLILVSMGKEKHEPGQTRNSWPKMVLKKLSFMKGNPKRKGNSAPWYIPVNTRRCHPCHAQSTQWFGSERGEGTFIARNNQFFHDTKFYSSVALSIHPAHTNITSTIASCTINSRTFRSRNGASVLEQTGTDTHTHIHE